MAPVKRRLSFSASESQSKVRSKLAKCERDPQLEWRILAPSNELNLPLTLLTGQTFLWKQTRPDIYTGVVANHHLVSLKHSHQHTLYHLHHHNHGQPLSKRGSDYEEQAVQALHDFFTLQTSVQSLWADFSAADPRFAAVAPYIQGVRLMRQNPVECVFQFICSSNNHIQRITKMVDHLAALGHPLGCVNGHCFYSFPTLEQLCLVTEDQLREAGFGYRAKYVVGTVAALRSKPGGGEAWLNSLRELPLDEAMVALCTLPGIGSKVAACVALYSLDKPHAVPVDTHVWRIAVRHLTPELSGKRATAKSHSQIALAFVARFGEYAGWAHIVLFIAELASYQKLLPPSLQQQSSRSPSKSSKRQTGKKKATSTRTSTPAAAA